VGIVLGVTFWWKWFVEKESDFHKRISIERVISDLGQQSLPPDFIDQAWDESCGDTLEDPGWLKIGHLAVYRGFTVNTYPAGSRARLGASIEVFH
jgi:hypothetical protein